MTALRIFSFCLLLAAVPLTQAAVVLQYHHIDTETPPITSIEPELFTQHMDYLAEEGFEVMALPELVKALKDGQSLPDKVAAITFDDGYRSVLDNAAPVLEEHGFPYTIFVNPQRVGSSQDFLSWKELKQLEKSGATIANHTLSHPHLIRRQEGESESDWKARVRQEIAGAEKAIIDKMGDSPALLAYPYGEYNSHIENLVKELELTAFAQHSGAFGSDVNWRAVPRFAFGGSYGGMQTYADKVNSLPLPLKSATAKDAKGKVIKEPLMPQGTKRPQLTLQLAEDGVADRMSCFASGQGSIEVKTEGNKVTTRPAEPLPVGRSRINCTASSGEPERFHWYSHFFIRKKDDGSWYPEY